MRGRENSGLNVVQATDIMVATRNAVSSAVNINCFTKAGFTTTYMPTEDEDWDDWRKPFSKIGYSDFVICDDYVLTSRLSTEDMCDAAERHKKQRCGNISVPTFGEEAA